LGGGMQDGFVEYSATDLFARTSSQRAVCVCVCEETSMMALCHGFAA